MGEEHAMGSVDTLPKFLQRNGDRYGDGKVAMREKDRGIWKRYTWKEYYEKVRHLALGLKRLGLGRGDKVAILGETKPEAYWAELAAQAAGGVSVGIFADCIPSEVNYYLTHSDSKFVFAHDQEQVDKLLQIRNQVPQVKKVIYWDPKGLWGYRDPLLMPLEELLHLGQDHERSNPRLFEEDVLRGTGRDPAVILYTSGTTGLPKGAVVSHEALIRPVEAFVQMEGYCGEDQYVSFIPLAWIGEQILGVASSLVAGVVVNFPERAETVQANIREIGPSLLLYAPRQWESVNRAVQAKMMDASSAKRLVYRLFLPLGYRMADSSLDRRRSSPLWRMLHWVSHWVLFRPLRANLGLKNVRAAYTAGSAVSPEIIRFFQAIGVNVKQLYGSSEMGIITAHRDDDIRPETSGRPLPGAAIVLSREGEILVKSQGMFMEYYKNPEAYREKFDDGWFRTGDFGHIDEEGHLIVMDRMEDLRVLSDGRRFSPQYTEVRLRFSPYIKDVLAVGNERRDFVAVLVNIDLDNVGRWAEARKIPYTTFPDLSQKPEVVALVREEIEKVNRTLPEGARVRKFLNLPKEFDPDEAELTRSRKIRRAFLEERYGDLIEALYSGEELHSMETPVVYRDGRKGVVKSQIRITSL
jgi:long-chain acyl-CoA synthetase